LAKRYQRYQSKLVLEQEFLRSLLNSFPVHSAQAQKDIII
jgi:hypothetical protein